MHWLDYLFYSHILFYVYHTFLYSYFIKETNFGKSHDQRSWTRDSPVHTYIRITNNLIYKFYSCLFWSMVDTKSESAHTCAGVWSSITEAMEGNCRRLPSRRHRRRANGPAGLHVPCYKLRMFSVMLTPINNLGWTVWRPRWRCDVILFPKHRHLDTYLYCSWLVFGEITCVYLLIINKILHIIIPWIIIYLLAQDLSTPVG